MNEHLYRVENVREVLHPFFEQLDQEFGKKYEIWVQAKRHKGQVLHFDFS